MCSHCRGHCELSLSSLEAFNMLMHTGLLPELVQEYSALIIFVHNSLLPFPIFALLYIHCFFFIWVLTGALLIKLSHCTLSFCGGIMTGELAPPYLNEPTASIHIKVAHKFALSFANFQKKLAEHYNCIETQLVILVP